MKTILHYYFPCYARAAKRFNIHNDYKDEVLNKDTIENILKNEVARKKYVECIFLQL